VKLSGEYWNVHCVSGARSAQRFTSFAPFTAMALMPALSSLKTFSRCTTEVELYTCRIAFFTPLRDSKVRWISSGRACVSTCTVTSSGMRLSTTRLRTKSKSGCEAAGKPISISLKPTSTSRSNITFFCITDMGSISAWLPSRRSTLHQRGALVMTLSGQVRSGIAMGRTGRYLR